MCQYQCVIRKSLLGTGCNEPLLKCHEVTIALSGVGVRQPDCHSSALGTAECFL